MKKIETSMIKMLMRISSHLLSVEPFSSLAFLSHTLAHIENSWSTWAYIGFGEER